MEKQAHKTEFPPLLAQGFHPRSPKEVMALCVTAFPESVVRAEIMAGLEVILGRIKHLSMDCEIWLNGSFTTQKIDPDDVDFIVFAPIAVLEIDSTELEEFIEWMNGNKDEPKKLFKCHTEIIFEDAESQFANDLIGETRRHYEGLYGYSVTTKEPKGIVVINLSVPDEVEEDEQTEEVAENSEKGSEA